MNNLITLFLVFFVPVSAKAINTISETELIPVKEGDTVQYPLNAESVETEAEINSLQYVCSLMPGDSFEVIRIYNMDYADRRSLIELQKKGGTSGNQTICHEGSSIEVMGAHELIISSDGTPQIVNKIRSPFVNWGYEFSGDIQRRKRLPAILATAETETILFKDDDFIVYPRDAEPIEVESNMYVDGNRFTFSCEVAPGDSFRVTSIKNLSNGNSFIFFKKEGGTPGSREICANETSTHIQVNNCVLQRTEEGLPEGLLCKHSLKTLFNPQEETGE